MLLDLLILFVVSNIIWSITYILVYPKHVWKNLNKLIKYDIATSLISILVLLAIIYTFKINIYINNQEIHPIFISLFISILTEIPYFIFYKKKYNIKYFDLAKSQTGISTPKDFFIALLISLVVAILFWIFKELLDNFL